ncbi:MAG TPA: FHA domain-containing protein [bacterium]|nr:FHA domain-containing protein [bacterium]
MNQVAKRQSPSLDKIRVAAFNAAGGVGEWSIAKDTVTIGRVSTNDVSLNDKKVSRNHATLELKEAGLLLRDLGSSNGTWVNGQKISEAFLNDLDVVVIAGYRLQISFERAAAMAPAAPFAPVAEATPAEDSNVIPMRAKAATPAAAPEKVRTDVVSIPAMEAEAKKAAAAPRTEKMPTREVNKALEVAKTEAARPTTMYVGGKKITRPATPAKASAPAPEALANGEKAGRFTRKEKIGLLVGFLVWGMGWAMIAGGMIGMVMLAPKPHAGF